MDVQIFKLTTGEEIIAKANPLKEGMWTLNKPVRIVPTQKGIGLMPYSPLLKNDTIHIKEEFILFNEEVSEEIFNAYSAQFGSGLVLSGSNLQIAEEEE